MAGVGVEGLELAQAGLVDQPRRPGVGQDLRVAGQRADRPAGQRGPHLGKVPVRDRRDPGHPQVAFCPHRRDRPPGAFTARDHILHDDGARVSGGRAFHQAGAGYARLGAYVGQGKAEPFGQGLGPGDPGGGDADDVADVVERRVGQRVVDQPAVGRERVEAAAVTAARRTDPGFPAEPPVPGQLQVHGEGPGFDQRRGDGGRVTRVGQGHALVRSRFSAASTMAWLPA
jgi:hypothetical protein